MSDITPLERWKRIVLKAFPWLARIRLAPSGALQIKSAAGRIELEGGGPQVLRVGDVGRLVFDPGVPMTTAPGLYYSPDASSAFTPVAMVPPGSTMGGTTPSLPGNTPSTTLAPKGSKKVTCG